MKITAKNFYIYFAIGAIIYFLIDYIPEYWMSNDVQTQVVYESQKVFKNFDDIQSYQNCREIVHKWRTFRGHPDDLQTYQDCKKILEDCEVTVEVKRKPVWERFGAEIICCTFMFAFVWLTVK